MQLTIEQALKQGVAAYKKGNLKNAEVFQSDTKIPSGSSRRKPQFGGISGTMNRTDAALPLLKAALEANPE